MHFAQLQPLLFEYTLLAPPQGLRMRWLFGRDRFSSRGWQGQVLRILNFTLLFKPSQAAPMPLLVFFVAFITALT